MKYAKVDVNDMGGTCFVLLWRHYSGTQLQEMRKIAKISVTIAGDLPRFQSNVSKYYPSPEVMAVNLTIPLGFSLSVCCVFKLQQIKIVWKEVINFSKINILYHTAMFL